MRIFVTGATGFIGGHLTERLVTDGHHVTALVRSPHKADRLRDLGVSLVSGDLSVFADPDFILDPHDVVVHLAGVVSAPDDATYEAINYGAVADLVRWLNEQPWSPRRLVFSSSLAAAGPSPTDRPLTEADPPRPIDPYGDAKARAEAALSAASFPTTSFRPPPVIGGGDPAFLPVFSLAARGLGVRVSGPPQRISWIGVDDLVAAILAMAHDTRTTHHVYFTTHEAVIDLDELWAGLSRAFDHRVRVIRLPGSLLAGLAGLTSAVLPRLGLTSSFDSKLVAQMRTPAFVCTSRALTTDLGWSAQVDLDQTLRRTLAGYRDRGWL